MRELNNNKKRKRENGDKKTLEDQRDSKAWPKSPTHRTSLKYTLKNYALSTQKTISKKHPDSNSITTECYNENQYKAFDYITEE
jgi:hypothetical protein